MVILHTLSKIDRDKQKDNNILLNRKGGFSMEERNNQNGAYAIQEQGDLGLGTTPIDPKYVGEDGKISIPKDDKERERG